MMRDSTSASMAWNDGEPSKPGHYLVVQEVGHMKYRFVRYWNGWVWHNPNSDKYGSIRFFMELPDFPC